MGIRFNADEVFSMAEQIESDGAAFYRRAAELNAEHAAFLQGLAAMEDQHKATFEAMHAEIGEGMREDTAADPYMEASMYLSAMASGHGGEGAPKVTAALTGKESLEDLLRIAIDLEAKSIIFYLGLKDMVPEKLGGKKIDSIIAEEKLHITMLAGELKKVRGDE